MWIHASSVFLSLAFGAATLAAESPSAQDYKSGLEQLAKLGLPPMQGAVWSRPPKEISRKGYRNEGDFQQLKVRLKGGTWILADNAGLLEFADPTTYPAAAEEERKEVPGVLGRMLGNFREQNPEPVKEPPKQPTKKPDSILATDVEAIIAALDSPAIREDLHSRMRYRSVELPGRCLLFAAQVDAAGETALANKLAEALFNTFPQRTQVIDGAVSVLANHELVAITEAFFTNHDWTAYHKGLKSLMEHFPRGWDKRLAVAMLMPALEKRVDGTPVPVPTLPDITISSEALEALSEWTEVPEKAADSDEQLAALHGIDLSEIPAEYRAEYLASLRRRGGSFDPEQNALWLLPADDGAEDAPPAANGVDRIKSLGMDALIALAAVAGDDTLTPLRNYDTRGGYFSSRDTMADKAVATYRSMDRPLSRGEIAGRMLADVLPGLEADDEVHDPLLLRDSAIEFWRTHRNKSRIELASLYLSDGTTEQQSAAAEFLAGSEELGAAEAFETIVLSASDVTVFTPFVSHYLGRKKAAARPFFESYAGMLREALEGVDVEQLSYSGGTYALREAGGVEPFLNKLGVLVGASSISDLIKDTVSSENPNYQSLGAAIATIPVTELLPVFAKAVAQAEPGTISPLLQTLAARGANEEEDRESSAPFPAELATLWLPIVRDETPLVLPEDQQSWFTYYDCETVGAAAALTLEFAFEENANHQVGTYLGVRGGDGTFPAFITRRTLARLTGEEMERYPSAEEVAPGRRREIATLASTLPALDLAAAVRELGFDERAAWLEWRAGVINEGQDPPVALLELRKLVTGRLKPDPDKFPDPDPALLDRLGLTPGFRVEAAALENLAAKLLKLADEKSGTVVSLRQAPLWLGLEAVTAKPAADDEDPHLQLLAASFDGQDPEPDALALANLDGGGRNSIWAIKDGKITTLKPSGDPRGDAVALYEEFLGTNNHYIPNFTFAVLAREDAKIHQPEDEEE